MCKKFTSSWGGTRKNPYAFTEQGIYMLMTVLKGPLATMQSKSDLAYQQMYSEAKHTIYVIDNYIGLRTLVQMKDVPNTIPITIISDNLQHHLHKSEYDAFVAGIDKMGEVNVMA